MPGVRLVVEEEHPKRQRIHAIEAGLRASHRQLRIPNAADLSTSILSNFSTLHDDETLMMQWVISPAVTAHKPVYKVAQTKEVSVRSVLFGNVATKDEIGRPLRKVG